MPGFLFRARSVGTGYELYAHGTPEKSSIITFIHFGVGCERVPICFRLCAVEQCCMMNNNKDRNVKLVF